MTSEAQRSLTRLLLPCAFVAAFFLAQIGKPDLHAQSRTNLKFLKSDTLVAAIQDYPKIWLPAYPVILYGVDRLGLPTKYFNLVCFFALLALISSFARKHLENVSPLAPIALLVTSGAIYANIQHVVAESFFTLLAFASLVLVVAYRERPTVAFTLALAVLVALASLTKHFGFVWLAPLAALYIVVIFARESALRAYSQLCLFAATTSALALPWFLWVKSETGRFFGANRTIPRNLPPKLEHWNDQVDFGTNVLFTVRTVLIDLFSPFQLAEHEVVEAPLYRAEVLIFAAVACVAVLALAFTIGALRRGAASESSRASEVVIDVRDANDSSLSAAGRALLHPTVVPAIFAGSYLAALIAVWSVANNDPIYTRFLYPAYPFLFLVALSSYSLVKARAPARWARAPFLVLFAAYLTFNANRFAIL